MNINRSSVIREVHLEICDGLSVTYTLFKEKTQGRTTYSVTLLTDGSGESATAPDITGDPELAGLIFDMILWGKVTPCCLCEVTEDLIESVSIQQ